MSCFSKDSPGLKALSWTVCWSSIFCDTGAKTCSWDKSWKTDSVRHKLMNESIHLKFFDMFCPCYMLLCSVKSCLLHRSLPHNSYCFLLLSCQSLTCSGTFVASVTHDCSENLRWKNFHVFIMIWQVYHTKFMNGSQCFHREKIRRSLCKNYKFCVIEVLIFTIFHYTIVIKASIVTSQIHY